MYEAVGLVPQDGGGNSSPYPCEATGLDVGSINNLAQATAELQETISAVGAMFFFGIQS